MLARFNSRNILNKNPFGAVKADEQITFAVYISNDTFVHFVKIYFLNANNDYHCEEYLNYCGLEDGYNKFSCKMSLNKPQIYYYHFEIDTQYGKFQGKCYDGELVLDENFPNWQLTVYDKNTTSPTWVNGSIMYQIFPDRFNRSEKFQPLPVKNHRTIHANWNDIPEFLYTNNKYKANDFYCGNLEGVIEKLDYLKGLNVDIIYFNPIFESPENHRYSTSDYTKIDPYLGDIDTFKRLVSECNKRDIRIILDGVFSHTGADSIYFNKFNNYDSLGAYNSMESPYYEWYKFFSYPDGYESWWGFRNLPNVDEEKESYVEYITNTNSGVVKLWNDFGIAGWRLDVADELPDSFLSKFRKSVKELNKDALIIGEVWEDATTKESYGVKRKYLLGEQLDSVMNYPFRTAIIDFVKHGDSKLFNNRIMSILENYPKPAIDTLMNIISTHDTKRIITELGVNREIKPQKQGEFKMNEEEYHTGVKMLKMAAFLQFTLPGIPSIYYGDEVGLQGFRDPYCRMGYPYGNENFEILEFYKKVSDFRKKHNKDMQSEFKNILCYDSIYCYNRGNSCFIINNSDTEKLVEIKNLSEKTFGDFDIVFNDYGVNMPPKSFGAFILI
jgi:4-alpha-glucanotransferase